MQPELILDRRVWASIFGSLAAFFALCSLMTAFSPPGINTLGHYAFLFLAVVLACEALRWHFNRSIGFLFLSLAFAYAICHAWSFFDWYESRWVGDGLGNKNWVYVDTVTRREKTVVYRRIRSASGEHWFMNEGPMVRDGVPHGHWVYRTAGARELHSWYWYGEEITEGEWHLRSQ